MLLKPFMTKILQMRANFSASRLICDENENILHPDKDHYSTESARLPRQTTTSVVERRYWMGSKNPVQMRVKTTVFFNFIESTHPALKTGL